MDEHNEHRPEINPLAGQLGSIGHNAVNTVAHGIETAAQLPSGILTPLVQLASWQIGRIFSAKGTGR